MSLDGHGKRNSLTYKKTAENKPWNISYLKPKVNDRSNIYFYAKEFCRFTVHTKTRVIYVSSGCLCTQNEKKNIAAFSNFTWSINIFCPMYKRKIQNKLFAFVLVMYITNVSVMWSYKYFCILLNFSLDKFGNDIIRNKLYISQN